MKSLFGRPDKELQIFHLYFVTHHFLSIIWPVDWMVTVEFSKFQTLSPHLDACIHCAITVNLLSNVHFKSCRCFVDLYMWNCYWKCFRGSVDFKFVLFWSRTRTCIRLFVFTVLKWISALLMHMFVRAFALLWTCNMMAEIKWCYVFWKIHKRTFLTKWTPIIVYCFWKITFVCFGVRLDCVGILKKK